MQKIKEGQRIEKYEIQKRKNRLKKIENVEMKEKI